MRWPASVFAKRASRLAILTDAKFIAFEVLYSRGNSNEVGYSLDKPAVRVEGWQVLAQKERIQRTT